MSIPFKPLSTRPSRYINSKLEKSEKKVVLLTDIPGTGKTTTAIDYCLKHNKNNMVYFGNHRLTWDFSIDMSLSHFKTFNLINVYYGNYKKLNTKTE